MPIPTIIDGQTLRSIRVDSINPTIEKVNTVDTRLSKVAPIVSNLGSQYGVDHRMIPFTTTSNTYTVSLPLTETEFVVRAVIRTFDSGNKVGTMKSATSLSYNRTTKILSVEVGTARSGQLYLELWRPV